MRISLRDDGVGEASNCDVLRFELELFLRCVCELTRDFFGVCYLLNV